MKGGFIILLICLSAALNSVKADEKDYTDFVKHLQVKIKDSPFKGAAYERLAYITDTYGPRLWGSNTL